MFLKALMIYYVAIAGGIVCLIFGGIYQWYSDNEEIKAQNEFDRRAANYYYDKDVEFSLYGEKLQGFAGPDSVGLRTSSG